MSRTTKKHTGNKRKAPPKKAKWITPAISTAIIAIIAVAAVLVLKGGDGVKAVRDADLVISLSDISDSVKFYPVEIDGTKLEVIAVKAPDGTVRTAFNTCQVCYDSGRGYYKQSGSVLVCQNCGNRFKMSQVEVESGGCNPVPIFGENKTVTDKTITISKEYLTEAKVIFGNWKTNY
ncbi:MAG: DUF2318 domain-containing protein [Oscillospiraceae bacterium]|jgi:uncharacterized membrane protein|nr:DUF2318 domain-containing protein [Oscillospiraceae bacterium]